MLIPYTGDPLLRSYVSLQESLYLSILIDIYTKFYYTQLDIFK